MNVSLNEILSKAQELHHHALNRTKKIREIKIDAGSLLSIDGIPFSATHGLSCVALNRRTYASIADELEYSICMLKAAIKQQ